MGMINPDDSYRLKNETGLQDFLHEKRDNLNLSGLNELVRNAERANDMESK